MKALPLKGRFDQPKSYEAKQFSLLPFDFERLDNERVLLTNINGEYAIVDSSDLESLVDGTLKSSSVAFKELESKQILHTGDGYRQSTYLPSRKGRK